MAQKRTHLPQRVHLEVSTVGALSPVWVSAPVGHTAIDGHG